MRNRGFSGYVLALLLILPIAGCGRGKTTGGPSQNAAGGRSAASDSASAGKGLPQGVSVNLLPPHPTAREGLMAVPRGCRGRIAFRWERNGKTIAGQTGARLPAGDVSKGDRVTVVMTSGGRTARSSLVIADSPPRIASVNFPNPDFHRGVDLVAEPRATDPDGDPVTFRYRWFVNGEEQMWDHSARLSGSRFHRGDRVFVEITPSDGEMTGAVFRSRKIVVPDAPPDFTSKPPGSFKGKVYVYNPVVEDPDGDKLTFSLEGAPKGMSIDPATGAIRWIIGNGDGGEHDVRIRVRDGHGGKASQEFKLAISI